MMRVSRAFGKCSVFLVREGGVGRTYIIHTKSFLWSWWLRMRMEQENDEVFTRLQLFLQISDEFCKAFDILRAGVL